tara:strand:- start:2413 stop:2994 length:582 start_codon:yes stop_codon:yes gene_type:complete
MSTVLYYSNYCSYCKNILLKLSKTKERSNIHFLCVDKRIKVDNRNYLVLENGEKILLPEIITKVPALMLLYRNNELLYGDDIHNHFDNLIQNNKVLESRGNDARSIQTDPVSFSMNDVMGSVKSDNFSFIDMSPEDLGAKGNGGTRMMYNYCSLDYNQKINTPTDDYVANKVDDTEYKKYQEEREQGIQIQRN